MIAFLNLESVYTSLADELDTAMKRVAKSGYYIGGPEVDKFEQDFANYVDAPFCIGTANGHDALVVAMLAHGVRAGDEVLVPANGCFATWLAIINARAVPVPVDNDPDTYLIDLNDARAKLTPKTKALISVHLYGQADDMAALNRFRDENNLIVIEDAAQAHGAKWAGKKIGSWGNTCAWSMYPSKNLGAMGDAGAVTTHDPEIADAVRMIGNYGSHIRYHNKFLGINSRLDPLQAAILSVKLNYLDQWNAHRADLAALYHQGLDPNKFVLPVQRAQSQSCWHLYVIRNARRDELQAYLTEHDIQTLIHYPIAPPYQEAVAHLNYAEKDARNAYAQQKELLSLPLGPHLTSEDVHHIIDIMNKF